MFVPLCVYVAALFILLYDFAVLSVHKYSLRNEIFLIETKIEHGKNDNDCCSDDIVVAVSLLLFLLLLLFCCCCSGCGCLTETVTSHTVHIMITCHILTTIHRYTT